MKPLAATRRPCSGITLFEVMIVVGVLGAIAIFFLWPRMAVCTVKSQRIGCVSRLKQIGLSTRQWAMDHGDTYPPSTALTNGGTMGHTFFSEPWIHLQTLSNELNTPAVLACPADRNVKEAKAFGSGFGRNNVSYFVGVDADEARPQMFLSGDRNLTTNGVRIGPGLFTANTNHLLGWDKTIHEHAGNVGLADGSVQQFSESALRNALAWEGMTNRLAIP